MNFVTDKHVDCAVLRILCARVDAVVAVELKLFFDQVLESGEKNFKFDLSDVVFMDSSGLGSLISCYKATGGKGEFVVCCPQPAVMELFDLTRMETIIDIRHSLDDDAERRSA